VHHRPASPPFTARVAGALTRWGLLLRGLLRALRRVRAGRVLLGGAVTTVVTGLVLAVPVVSSGSVLSSLFTDSSPDAPSRPVEDPVFTEPSGGWPDASAPAPGTTPAVPDTAPTAPATSSTTDPTTPSSAAAGSPAPAPSSSSSSSPDATSSSGAAPSSSSDASSAPGTPTTEAASPPVPAELSPADDLLGVLDRTRAAAGCAPLSPDDGLIEAAREHSAAMRDEDFLGLVDDEGDSVLETADARAGWVAQGSRSPLDIVNGWLAEGDAASLQDCSLTAVGIGRTGGDSGPWWTLLLA
jgi:uncharacterized protein YkwD